MRRFVFEIGATASQKHRKHTRNTTRIPCKYNQMNLTTIRHTPVSKAEAQLLGCKQYDHTLHAPRPVYIKRNMSTLSIWGDAFLCKKVSHHHCYNCVLNRLLHPKDSSFLEINHQPTHSVRSPNEFPTCHRFPGASEQNASTNGISEDEQQTRSLMLSHHGANVLFMHPAWAATRSKKTEHVDVVLMTSSMSP